MACAARQQGLRYHNSFAGKDIKHKIDGDVVIEPGSLEAIQTYGVVWNVEYVAGGNRNSRPSTRDAQLGLTCDAPLFSSDPSVPSV